MWRCYGRFSAVPTPAQQGYAVFRQLVSVVGHTIMSAESEGYTATAPPDPYASISHGLELLLCDSAMDDSALCQLLRRSCMAKKCVAQISGACASRWKLATPAQFNHQYGQAGT